MTIIYACDIGGTRIKLALIQNGRMIARGELAAEPEAGLAAVFSRVARERPALCRAAGVDEREIGGFALAFPGVVEPGTHRILSAPRGKFDEASRLDVHRLIRRELDLPAYIVNDANAALAGESMFGAAQGFANVVMMTLGTGIGTAAIMNGVPLRGKHGLAGNLGGHFTANPRGAVCPCGNAGCAETEASTWALAGHAHARREFSGSLLAQEPLLDYRAVFDCALRGDDLATELRNQALDVWAGVVVNLIHAYDPDRVVIGGGVMNSGTMILEHVRAYVDRHAWTPWGKVTVVRAELGNDAGLFGVAGLATLQVFREEGR